MIHGTSFEVARMYGNHSVGPIGMVFSHYALHTRYALHNARILELFHYTQKT